MNVYDFDGTIYDGESVFDFYLYSVRKQPKLAKYLFIVVKTLVLYKLCRVPEEELMRLAQKYARQYLQEIRDLEKKISDFWDKNQHKIKSFYLQQKREDDVIISASIHMLLEEMLKRIGVKHCIASVIDIKSGEVQQICYRKTKVDLFRKAYPDASVDCFYTDSLNDKAMMQLAKKTYLVKGNKVTLMEG